MRKILVLSFLMGLTATAAEAKVCFLPGIFGGDESCLTDEQYAECRGFEQTLPCPAGQEQITCTKDNKVYYHCYCRSDTYDLIDHPEYRCKKGYTAECGCAAENLECAPEYVYEGDGLGHCKDYANTDGIDACVLPNGKVYYKDCECNKDNFPYSCRDTGFKHPIDKARTCEDPHGVELYSECDCDENAGWSENCEHRTDGCTQPVSENKVGTKTCSQCEEIVCESDDLFNIEAYLCGASRSVTFDCATLGYVYTPTGVCPVGSGNAGKAGIKCPFDRNYMNCETPDNGYPNEQTCLEANEGATECQLDSGEYKVTKCDVERGYYFNGETCLPSTCPTGYSTFVTSCVGDGYSFEKNGMSGGENCAKCVCAPSEDCVYTPQRSNVSTIMIGGAPQRPVYVGNGSASGLCCNGYYKTCNSLCSGRDLVADYDPNMEEYELCEACGKKYYTITKCKDSFAVKEGKCVASSCDTVNGYTTEVENVGHCKTNNGLYEGALGWKMESQKDASGNIVRSAGEICNKCICEEPAIPSDTDVCRWSNMNKNTNGYLKPEDLCCNGYYKNCYADLPPEATEAACNDAKADQRDYYAACDMPRVCIIRSCVAGYEVKNNKCVPASCPSPYSTDAQSVDKCGSGNGWAIEVATDGQGNALKSGDLSCTQCQCTASASCTWDDVNKGVADLTDLCCNNKYATCTSNCNGYLLENLVIGTGANVEQGVNEKVECKACGQSYWVATSCKTDNGYTLSSDGKCEHTGCPSGYTAGLTSCESGYTHQAHSQKDNGAVCGKCEVNNCSAYADYPLEECPDGWDCEHEDKQTGSTTKTCYKKTTCDNTHCGGNCETTTNACSTYPHDHQIEHATMSTNTCERVTGNGTNTCSAVTVMYKDFTCDDVNGWKKNDAGTACVAMECEDRGLLTQCPSGQDCQDRSAILGGESKPCKLPSGSCDENHCGENCATQVVPCVGYSYPNVLNATMGTEHCDKVVADGNACSPTTRMYKSFECNEGWKKCNNDTACCAMDCPDYEGWLGSCPTGWTCDEEDKKTGSVTKTCFKKKQCKPNYCGTNCATAIPTCNYTYDHVIEHATMSTNRCNKITGGGTSTCSSPTTMYEDFTCDRTNGWKKNDAGTACVAMGCKDWDSNYVDTCPSGQSCSTVNVMSGGVEKECKNPSGGCDSSHCGTGCATEVNTCENAPYDAIDHAQMIDECIKIVKNGNACTQPVSKYRNFTCETGYRPEGASCVAKECSNNEDGYVYASESECEEANTGRSCTRSSSKYQLGSNSQYCWKVGTACATGYCGENCTTVEKTCPGAYTIEIANATMSGLCEATCGNSNTWDDFTCNSGWKKNAGATGCIAKTCADNTDDGYIHALEAACLAESAGHSCVYKDGYQLGNNTNQRCWKPGSSCDSNHCGTGCATAVSADDCGRYPYTESNKPEHSTLVGNSCVKKTGGTSDCKPETTYWDRFECDSVDGWKLNPDGDGCIAMSCAQYSSSYPLEECTGNWNCSSTPLGFTGKTCYAHSGCKSGFCNENNNCSTSTKSCSSTIYPYTADSKPAHSTPSGAECVPITGSDTCSYGTKRYADYTCDGANGWKKKEDGRACVAMTCADHGLDGYTTDECPQGQTQNLASDKMIGGELKTCRTCINATCPENYAVNQAGCGEGRKLQTSTPHPTAWSGSQQCFACTCDNTQGYYDLCPDGASCTTASNGCQKTTGCKTSEGYIPLTTAGVSSYVYTTESFNLNGANTDCVKPTACDTSVAVTSTTGYTSAVSFTNYNLNNIPCSRPTGCTSPYENLNQTCETGKGSPYQTIDTKTVPGYTCRLCKKGCESGYATSVAGCGTTGAAGWILSDNANGVSELENGATCYECVAKVCEDYGYETEVIPSTEEMCAAFAVGTSPVTLGNNTSGHCYENRACNSDANGWDSTYYTPTDTSFTIGLIFNQTTETCFTEESNCGCEARTYSCWKLRKYTGSETPNGITLNGKYIYDIANCYKLYGESSAVGLMTENTAKISNCIDMGFDSYAQSDEGLAEYEEYIDECIADCVANGGTNFACQRSCGGRILIGGNLIRPKACTKPDTSVCDKTCSERGYFDEGQCPSNGTCSSVSGTSCVTLTSCATGYHKTGTGTSAECVANTCAANGVAYYADGDCSGVDTDCYQCTEHSVATPSGTIACHSTTQRACEDLSCRKPLTFKDEDEEPCTYDAECTGMSFGICYKPLYTSCINTSDYTCVEVPVVSSVTQNVCRTCYYKQNKIVIDPIDQCASGYSSKSDCETANASILKSGESCTKSGSCYIAYCTKNKYSDLSTLAIDLIHSTRSCTGSGCRKASQCGDSEALGWYGDNCVAKKEYSVNENISTKSEYEKCVETLTYDEDLISAWNASCSAQISVSYAFSTLEGNCGTCYCTSSGSGNNNYGLIPCGCMAAP